MLPIETTVRQTHASWLKENNDAKELQGWVRSSVVESLPSACETMAPQKTTLRCSNPRAPDASLQGWSSELISKHAAMTPSAQALFPSSQLRSQITRDPPSTGLLSRVRLNMPVINGVFSVAPEKPLSGSSANIPANHFLLRAGKCKRGGGPYHPGETPAQRGRTFFQSCENHPGPLRKEEN